MPESEEPHLMRYPQIVDESVGRYVEYLEWARQKPRLSVEAGAAMEKLTHTLRAAQTKRTDLTPADVSFGYKDLWPDVSMAEIELFVNQYTLGCGDDGAPAVVMGTEEAYSADKGGLALGACCSAVPWLCNSRVDVLLAVDGRGLDFDRQPRPRAYHIHPNDLFQVQHLPGTNTWEVVAHLLAGNKLAAAAMLDQGSAKPSLGDLCYQIDVSAWPSLKAGGGKPPAPDRIEFLEYLLATMRQTARVLVFHGRPGDPDWGSRRRLTQAFLGPESQPQLIRDKTWGFWVARTDDRVVLLTRALSGMIRDDYVRAAHAVIEPFLVTTL